MTPEQARALYLAHWSVGGMEQYGEKAAVAAILKIANAASDALDAWERLVPIMPIDERIEDAEFGEFLRLRSVLKRGMFA